MNYERSNTSRTSNKKKKKNKKRFSKKIFMFFLSIIFFIGIGMFLLNFEAFNLKEIKINGTDKYTSENIVNELHVTYGENIFKEMYKLKHSDFSNFSYIDNVKIKFTSNNVITLKVKERISSYIAFNKENNKYYRLDENGVILEECEVSSKTDEEIILTGISFDEEVIIGSYISDVYVKKIHSFLHIKEEYEKTSLKDYGSITKVNFNNTLTTLVINDKLNIVIQNDSNLSYHLSLLQGIIQKLPDGSSGTIDMTKQNPVYLAPY